MRNLVVILIVTLLVGCYNSADKPHICPELPIPTTTIAALHDIVGSGGVVLSDDIVVEGWVVSSDRDDNFFRTFVVEADGRAVEVMAGLSELEATYPVGLRVVLRLGGCYADYGYGVLQVGRRSSGSYAVDYLASPEAVDRVVVRSLDVQPVMPRTMHLADLHKSMCGTLVRIEGLRLVSSSSVDTEAGELLRDACWAGYAVFKDMRGDSIVLYTRDYARFAQRCIPCEEVALTGILQWGRYEGSEGFQLKMRYEEDCALR